MQAEHVPWMSFADESAKQERRERFRTALHFIALLAGRELPVTGNLVDQQTGRRAPGIEYQHTLTTVAVRRRQMAQARQIDDRHQFAHDIVRQRVGRENVRLYE